MSYSTTINIDDGDVTRLWDVACEVVNIDPNTGVATITITPRGGKARLPAIYDGAPGLPPFFDPAYTQVVVVGPDDIVPAPEVSLLTPGGPGVQSTYGLKFYVPQGATGAADTTLLDATDVVGTPAAGYQIIYTTDTGLAAGGASNSTPGGVWVPRKTGGIFAATTITATSGNGSPRTLTSIAIPGQLFPWRPKVWGYVVVGNSPDTKVDLMATVGNGTSSGGADDQVAYMPGILGSTVQPVALNPVGWGGALTGSTGGKYGAGLGVVPTGQATTVFLIAKQMASTTSPWTTPAAGPNAAFSVEVSPIP